MQFFRSKPATIPSPAEALPGRPEPIMKPGIHRVLGTPIAGPWPDGTKTAVFGLGCFWGDEKDFWQLPGVVTTAVGYAGGTTPNPTYQEACSGRTGHAEVVLVAFHPARISYEQLLKTFWENHDPATANRQAGVPSWPWISPLSSSVPGSYGSPPSPPRWPCCWARACTRRRRRRRARPSPRNR